MKNVKLIFLVILIFFPSSTFSQKNKSKASSREITNIAAFGRAYGIVRFFYPSKKILHQFNSKISLFKFVKS
ncbi:MAG: hypothetical protein O9294_10370 [Cytophagales bacterium]|jgi:hypothetical protein|nr:hypothetical protein [Cytophagales bacterium]